MKPTSLLDVTSMALHKAKTSEDSQGPARHLRDLGGCAAPSSAMQLLRRDVCIFLGSHLDSMAAQRPLIILRL